MSNKFICELTLVEWYMINQLLLPGRTQQLFAMEQCITYVRWDCSPLGNYRSTHFIISSFEELSVPQNQVVSFLLSGGVKPIYPSILSPFKWDSDKVHGTISVTWLGAEIERGLLIGLRPQRDTFGALPGAHVKPMSNHIDLIQFDFSESEIVSMQINIVQSKKQKPYNKDSFLKT